MRHFVMLAFTAACATAQAPSPESRPTADSLRALLPDSLHAMGDSALSGSSDISRMTAYGRLMTAPEAEQFVFRGLESEPDPQVRHIEVLNIGILAHLRPAFTAAAARDFLRGLIKRDPDSVVVRDAFQALRIVDAVTDKQILDERVAAEHAAPDWLLREQERAHTLSDGIALPAFMSDPPKVFAAPVAHSTIRLFAFGDWGWPDSGRVGTAQGAVAEAIRRAHAGRPFDLGLTLGDNFYGTGLPSPASQRWRIQYEAVYSSMDVPVYASLGNHDYYSEDSPAAEIAYTWRSPTWRMPARYYTFTAGPAQFFAIDGNDLAPRQLAWLARELQRSTARWKIVYGHFPPYLTTKLFPGRPRITEDSAVVATLVPILRGHADVYIAGHSHTFQYFKPIEGVQYIIAGTGGATLYDVNPDDPRLRYATATSGFASITVTDSTFTTTFVGADGKALFSHTVRH
jgi:tartrate-resistant acid phosphatase type 5